MGTRERIRPLRDDVRRDVLAAAHDEFAERGYHRASLAAISTRAGYSKGAVYSNFASKDDLFLALLEPVALDMAAALIDPEEPTLRGVAAALQTLGVGSRANLLFAEFRAHAARDGALAARLGEARAQVVDALAERLTEQVERLGLRVRVPTTEAVTILLALVNGLALEHVGLAEPAVGIDALESVLAGLVEAR